MNAWYLVLSLTSEVGPADCWRGGELGMPPALRVAVLRRDAAHEPGRAGQGCP